MSPNGESSAKDYETRVAAAGGEDTLTASLVKAVKQARRVQYLVVGGLILLLGIVAVLTVTIIDTNKTADKATMLAERADDTQVRGEANRKRALANSKQSNEIIRCLTKRKDPGKCLGLTVEPGTPGSSGLRGLSGTAGLSGPMGARGARGAAGGRGALGPAGPFGPMGLRGLRGESGGGLNGTNGSDGKDGEQGERGEDGGPGMDGAPGRPPTDAELDAAVQRFCSQPEQPCRGADGSPGPPGPMGEPGMDAAPPPPPPQ